MRRIAAFSQYIPPCRRCKDDDSFPHIGLRYTGTGRASVTGLTGVRNIKNNIEIAWEADPMDVTLLVQDALDRSALIPDDSDVEVTASGNTVTLYGHVRTWAEHDAATDAAWRASGVYFVSDQLIVTG